MESTLRPDAEHFATLSDKDLLSVVAERGSNYSDQVLSLANTEIVGRGGMSDLMLRVEAMSSTGSWLKTNELCLKCGEAADLTVRERHSKRFICPSCNTAQDLNDRTEMARTLIMLHAPFNFGACFLAPIWAMSHGAIMGGAAIIALTLIALFVKWEGTIPILAVAIVFGFLGNKIAWNRCHYKSIKELKERERIWNRAGLVMGAVVTLMVLSLLFRSS